MNIENFFPSMILEIWDTIIQKMGDKERDTYSMISQSYLFTEIDAIIKDSEMTPDDLKDIIFKTLYYCTDNTSFTFKKEKKESIKWISPTFGQIILDRWITFYEYGDTLFSLLSKNLDAEYMYPFFCDILTRFEFNCMLFFAVKYEYVIKTLDEKYAISEKYMDKLMVHISNAYRWIKFDGEKDEFEKIPNSIEFQCDRINRSRIIRSICDTLNLDEKIECLANNIIYKLYSGNSEMAKCLGAVYTSCLYNKSLVTYRELEFRFGIDAKFIQNQVSILNKLGIPIPPISPNHYLKYLQRIGINAEDQKMFLDIMKKASGKMSSATINNLVAKTVYYIIKNKNYPIFQYQIAKLFFTTTAKIREGYPKFKKMVMRDG